MWKLPYSLERTASPDSTAPKLYKILFIIWSFIQYLCKIVRYIRWIQRLGIIAIRVSQHHIATERSKSSLVERTSLITKQHAHQKASEIHITSYRGDTVVVPTVSALEGNILGTCYFKWWVEFRHYVHTFSRTTGTVECESIVDSHSTVSISIQVMLLLHKSQNHSGVYKISVHKKQSSLKCAMSLRDQLWKSEGTHLLISYRSWKAHIHR